MRQKIGDIVCFLEITIILGYFLESVAVCPEMLSIGPCLLKLHVCGEFQNSGPRRCRLFFSDPSSEKG